MAATTTQLVAADQDVKVETPEGYETLFEAALRRSTGTFAAAYRPTTKFMVKCEHGAESGAKDRKEAFEKATNPDTFCRKCKNAAGKREQKEIEKLEAKLAALKGDTPENAAA